MGRRKSVKPKYPFGEEIIKEGIIAELAPVPLLSNPEIFPIESPTNASGPVDPVPQNAGYGPSLASNLPTRPPKSEVIRRRNRVKELAGLTVEEISEKLERENYRFFSIATVNRDLDALRMVKKRMTKK